MITCAILIALSGGILFFIGREPASQDPAEQIAAEQNDTPYPQLTDQQLRPFADASAALATDGNYTVKANTTLGFIEITWWSPAWTETIASSENTAPDKWSDLTSAAAELTSEMQLTTENLGYARTVFQIVDDSNASTIYATCQGGKVLYDIFAETEAEESQANDPIVYVSESGSRYHKDPTCGGHTLHPLLRSLALKNGLSPCKKCVM